VPNDQVSTGSDFSIREVASRSDGNALSLNGYGTYVDRTTAFGRERRWQIEFLSPDV
jgi:hypothetical protein